MAFADTITTVGNKIIALVNTRSKTDLSNITSAGETVIRNLASGSVPVGTVIAYMGTTEPDGYLLMDGRVLSQETYADLYNVVGVSQLPSGATESGGVYTWTDSSGITYSTGDGTDDDTHKYKMFAIADMTDGRYLMGSTVAGTRNLKSEIPNIFGWFHILGNGLYQSFISVTGANGCFRADNSHKIDGHSVNYNEQNEAWNPYLSAELCCDRYGSYSEVRPLSLSCKMIIRY